MALALEAPAKINLWLRVLGRRPDGYHDVETVLHALAFHDDVVVELSPDGIQDIELCVVSEAVTGFEVPAGAGNLVVRAARSFLAAAGLASGCRIHLTKRIPAGAGLGGGSSDAATTLLLLNALAGGPLDSPALLGCARELGADVPFFLEAGTQVGRGRGDELRPWKRHPHMHVLLALPRLGTSTAAVYAGFDKNQDPGLTPQKGVASMPLDEAHEHEEVAMPRGFRNDLESSALRLYPELGAIRDRIDRSGCGRAHLSGTGSAWFMAFATSDECASARSCLDPLSGQGIALLQTESAPSRRGAPREVAFPEQQ